MDNQCEAITKSGKRCKNPQMEGSFFCHIHAEQASQNHESDIEEDSLDEGTGNDVVDLSEPGIDQSVDLEAEKARWPRGRDLSREEIAHILERHHLWRRSKGRKGEQADLSYANLFMQTSDNLWLPYANLRGIRLMSSSLRNAVFSNADLRGASLNDADLRDASFWDADLSGAYLRESKLSGVHLNSANLRGARLEGANFESEEKTERELDDEYDEFVGMFDPDDIPDDYEPAKIRSAADLTGTDLRDADLSEARLSGVTGLRSDSLAGANLSNSKLPEDIAKFELLDYVAEISKSARGTFLALIGACFYCWLTVATTKADALLSDDVATKLPILNTDVPTAAFYVVAPIVLLGIYIYLHMYLLRLWQSLGTLPARFPDGRWLDEKAYPWLMTSLVRLYVPLLKQNRPPLWWLQVGISIFAAWTLVPITILGMLLGYLISGNIVGTLVIVLSLLAALAVGISTFDVAQMSLRGDKTRRVPAYVSTGVKWIRQKTGKVTE